VEWRFQRHWKVEGLARGVSWEQKLRLPFDQGSEHDGEAVGRWLRDHEIMAQTEEGAKAVKSGRGENEGLNAESKRLPFALAGGGAGDVPQG